MDRSPAVSGQFYPARPVELRRQVIGFLAAAQTRAALGVIAPHAGYIYSGAIAGEVYCRVRVPGRVIILGPNHHGRGHPAAVYPEGNWITPLGEVPVDAAFAARLLAACPVTGADTAAHRMEHSLEVQLPFLQLCRPGLQIVPLCLSHLPLAQLLELGAGLGRLIQAENDPTLIVASSDMTHYEPGPVARDKDRQALDRVTALDPSGLYHTVREGGITMCGVLPTVVMLAAARQLGASSAELIRYGNSGDVTGDQQEVVGYAGVAVWTPQPE
jgi:AmmeMemoRadiSam system protein B